MLKSSILNGLVDSKRPSLDQISRVNYMLKEEFGIPVHDEIG